MIHSRITTKAQTTVPLAVRRALNVAPGDDLAWELNGDHVVLRRVADDDGSAVSDFSAFTEWQDELDDAFDDL